MKAIDTVVLDLDNTLWDWVGIWYATFRAQLDELVRISGVPEAQLKREIRAVHQRVGTSEYSLLLREVPSLQAAYPGQDVVEAYADAIGAFRAARRKVMRLYPTVAETLGEINRRGCVVAAYTESKAFYTSYRVRRFGLDGLIDVLYSPADHEFPEGINPRELRSYPPEEYELKRTVHRHTPAGELKPNPAIMRTILHNVGSEPRSTVYVGDSLMKDVAMAQDSGVYDVYAAYGDTRDSEAYELLKEVTHWPDADVDREKQIDKQALVKPSYTLVHTFGELLALFQFAKHPAKAAA